VQQHVFAEVANLSTLRQCLKPHGDTGFRHVGFGFGNSIFAKVKYRCSQNRTGVAFGYAFDQVVEVADTAAGFSDAISRVLASPPDPAPGRARVEQETWTAKGKAALAALSGRGIEPMNPSAA